MCIFAFSDTGGFHPLRMYMARIYVASSWRNAYFPEVVKRLREFGHEMNLMRIFSYCRQKTALIAGKLATV